jgi:hypothetical protein
LDDSVVAGSKNLILCDFCNDARANTWEMGWKRKAEMARETAACLCLRQPYMQDQDNAYVKLLATALCVVHLPQNQVAKIMMKKLHDRESQVQL